MYTMIGEQNIAKVTMELDSICQYAMTAYPAVVAIYQGSGVKTPYMLRMSMSSIPICDTGIQVNLDERMISRLITIYSYLEQQNIPTSFVLLDTVTLAILSRFVKERGG